MWVRNDFKTPTEYAPFVPPAERTRERHLESEGIVRLREWKEKEEAGWRR